MNLEQKKAIQTVLIDEISRRAESQPTLLIDALLQNQGPALVYHVIHTRWGMATNLAQMLTQLLTALQGTEAPVPQETWPVPPPGPPGEEAA